VAAHRGESGGVREGATPWGRATECGRRSAARGAPVRIWFERGGCVRWDGMQCGKVKYISVGPTKLTQIPPLRGGSIFGCVSPN
jgi:hypothetical protein